MNIELNNLFAEDWAQSRNHQQSFSKNRQVIITQ